MTRQFCGKCGTQLTYRHEEEPGTIDVTACSLDEVDPVSPEDHVWCDRMVPWLRIDDGLPRYGLGRFDGAASPGSDIADLSLTIGNCNYSSWSLRAWLALRLTGAAFLEDRIWFDQDGDRKQRFERSPAGKVPVLRHGNLAIWDSLAICEYLAEIGPNAGLWPADRDARARARSLCCEMHSGFEAIRARMPFNSRARRPYRNRGEAVGREIERIRAMWEQTRIEHGRGGPFLFGPPGIVDAYYAPVAGRFRTYGVQLEGEAGAYLDALLTWELLREWSKRAEAETQKAPEYDRLTAEA